jgi:hypothetical protein
MSSTALFCGNLEPQEVMPGPAFGVGTVVAVRGSCAATAMLVFKVELPRVDPEVPNEKIISTQSLTSATDELLDVEVPAGALGMRVSIENTSGTKITFDVEFTVYAAAEVQARKAVSEPRTLNASSPETAKAAISDLEVWGDPDMVKLLAKASSRQQGFMKTMKAVDLGGGVIVQFETQQRCGDTALGEMHVALEANAPALTLVEARAKYPELIVVEVEERTIAGLRHTVLHYKYPGSEWALSQSAVYVPGARIEEAAQAEKGVTSRKLVVPTAAEAVEKISASLTAMGEQVGAAFGQAMQKELT